MKKSRFLFTLGLLVVLLLTVSSSAQGGQTKVDVCHITATYDFGSGPVPIGHVISVADPAYPVHIGHGDPEVWIVVSLPDGKQVCTAQVDTHKIVFISEQNFSVGGGLSSADAICQNAAADANLPGSFKAWLSAEGSGNSAAERLSHSSVPYMVRIASDDGFTLAQVALDWDDLVDGQLERSIDRNEKGACTLDTSDCDAITDVWTSTTASGSYSGEGDCSGWSAAGAGITGGYGQSHATITNSAWTQFGVSSNCAASQHLYCFQQ